MSIANADVRQTIALHSIQAKIRKSTENLYKNSLTIPIPASFLIIIRSNMPFIFFIGTAENSHEKA
jgi:hypothetical protein